MISPIFVNFTLILPLFISPPIHTFCLFTSHCSFHTYFAIPFTPFVYSSAPIVHFTPTLPPIHTFCLQFTSHCSFHTYFASHSHLLFTVHLPLFISHLLCLPFTPFVYSSPPIVHFTPTLPPIHTFCLQFTSHCSFHTYFASHSHLLFTVHLPLFISHLLCLPFTPSVYSSPPIVHFTPTLPPIHTFCLQFTSHCSFHTYFASHSHLLFTVHLPLFISHLLCLPFTPSVYSSPPIVHFTPTLPPIHTFCLQFTSHCSFHTYFASHSHLLFTVHLPLFISHLLCLPFTPFVYSSPPIVHFTPTLPPIHTFCLQFTSHCSFHTYFASHSHLLFTVHLPLFISHLLCLPFTPSVYSSPPIVHFTPTLPPIHTFCLQFTSHCSFHTYFASHSHLLFTVHLPLFISHLLCLPFTPSVYSSPPIVHFTPTLPPIHTFCLQFTSHCSFHTYLGSHSHRFHLIYRATQIFFRGIGLYPHVHVYIHTYIHTGRQAGR